MLLQLVRFTLLSGLNILLSLVTFSLLSTPALHAQEGDDKTPPLQWWKGNLHTHSLWSDGDEFPEVIAQWYRDQGYHFLGLSDHNVLSQGLRWMPLKQIVSRSDDGILDRYRKVFGAGWVETRGKPESDDFAVRLKPWDEFCCLVEERGRFIMIPAEEISDKAEGKPVHMNAMNLLEAIQPLGGKTVREAMENNLRQVLEQEKKAGREILPHLNHPNFGYAITAEDLASVVNERFFEVFNGHPGVNQLGDETHPSIERIWDVANTIRLVSLSAAPLMGVGTDDSHEYHGKPGARPGRGWVMVRCRYLTPEHLIRAMKASEFYASSGVTLEDFQFDPTKRTLSLQIAPDGDATFTTEFVVSMKPKQDVPQEAGALPPVDEIGKVAATVTGNRAEYQMTGEELYVRARVSSSRAPHDPAWKTQKAQAWTQPYGF